MINLNLKNTYENLIEDLAAKIAELAKNTPADKYLVNKLLPPQADGVLWCLEQL